MGGKPVNSTLEGDGGMAEFIREMIFWAAGRFRFDALHVEIRLH
jgi:hypothetical protein